MIRSLIIDDETLAREGIRVRLAQEPDIEIVGEAEDGPEAVSAIVRLAPQLVFLDIGVPGYDGFEVLARAARARAPYVIVVTAHDRYAVRAFDAHARDYLLKPIDDVRFREAVRRARAELDAAATPSAAAHPVLCRLPVKDGDRFVLLATQEVSWFEAAANYVQVHARGRTFLLRGTMGDMEARLDPKHFARIHRSTIVNVDHIREIRPQWQGDFDVVLNDGVTLRMSRGYRERLLSVDGR